MRQAAATRKQRGIPVWIIVLVLIVVGAGGYAGYARPWETRPLKVKTEMLALGPASQVLAVNGRVAAKRSVVLRPTVQARLMTVSVGEGDSVTAGQLIAELDDVEPRALVDQAMAALEAGVSRRDQAQGNLERTQALGDNVTRTTLNDAQVALNVADNEVTRLRALLAQAQNQLAQYQFRAPFDGVVLASAAEAGQIVDPQTELFTIADLRDLLVETDVDELYSAKVHKGLRALLKPAGGTTAQGGVVSFAAPTVDPLTGGRAVKISFDAPVDLPIGLTVNANIIVAASDSALSIPRGALRTDGTRAYVLVDEGGIARERDVQFVDWPADRLEVASGLSAGDVVILEPEKVKVGQAVAAGG